MSVYSLPALVVGLTVALYWARVMRMAAKTRRRTGNAANFFPPEKLGRVLRVLWIPSIAIWITVPLVAALRAKPQAPLALLHQDHHIAWPAAVVVVLCLAASWICWRKMGKSWRMGINPNEKTQLIVSGPYAYVRHPIYGLSTLMMLASMVAAPSVLLIAAGVVHLTLLQWESRREERYLIGIHGETYANYRRQVGRFLPVSLTPFRGVAAEEASA